MAIAGLTERPALFLLERLAWDHGLRVVFEAEHDPDGRGGAAHRSCARRSGPRARARRRGAGLAGVLADALIAGHRHCGARLPPDRAGLAAHLGESMKLYSWIIAPRHGGLRKGRS
jgi:hypothetical protein